MNKKGSLNLSIQAIVIIVIAFVVLGLALTFVRLGFDKSTTQLVGVIDDNALKTPATSGNPITMTELSIKRNNAVDLEVAYYNKDSDEHKDVSLRVKTCITSKAEAKAKITKDSLPTVEAVAQNVPPSAQKGYTILFKENGLLGNEKYICVMEAFSEGEDDPWETKQFTLKVTS